MAHTAQHQFIASLRYQYPSHFAGCKILEVGSVNINGSIRDLFTNPTVYVGLDLAKGKDVDMVCHGADYKTDEPFDTVISTEAFEHDVRWIETFSNMINVCRSGGLVAFTCASHNRFEHGTKRTTPFDNAVATDYYRNLNAIDFETVFALNMIFGRYVWEANQNDLYFFGVKR